MDGSEKCTRVVSFLVVVRFALRALTSQDRRPSRTSTGRMHKRYELLISTHTHIT